MDLNSFIHIAHAAEATTEASGGVVGTLGLNAKLFIAQLVNFAIVLFVLWRWVFKPVANGLEARTAKIEQSLRDADTTEQERAQFQQWKNEEIAKTRKQAAEIIATAKSDADAVKTSMMIDTRNEQEKLIERTKQQLAMEQTKTITEAKQQLADLVVTATEKILQSKLDEKKDKELIKKTLENL